MGYSESDARSALRMCQFVVSDAIEVLLTERPRLTAWIEDDKKKQVAKDEDKKNQEAQQTMQDFFDNEPDVKNITVADFNKRIDTFEL